MRSRLQWQNKFAYEGRVFVDNRGIGKCEDILLFESVDYWQCSILENLCYKLGIQIFPKVIKLGNWCNNFMFHYLQWVEHLPYGLPNCSAISTNDLTSLLYLVCQQPAFSWWAVHKLVVSNTSSNSSIHREKSGTTGITRMRASGFSCRPKAPAWACRFLFGRSFELSLPMRLNFELTYEKLSLQLWVHLR